MTGRPSSESRERLASTTPSRVRHKLSGRSTELSFATMPTGSSLDLDGGVKVNYDKFGTLLAKVATVHGQKAEES